MANLNNEGFAIAPQAECVNGLKPVIWADDSNSDSHALRTGKIKCTVPTVDPVPTVTAPPVVVSTTTTTPPPVALADRTAPQLKLALKLSKTVRRTGKFRAVITLSERADLTITASARKNARTKARTILRTTRKGVAAGKPTFTLSLTRRVRAALRKGETVTLTVQARDAAGNITTSRATAKVL